MKLGFVFLLFVFVCSCGNVNTHDLSDQDSLSTTKTSCQFTSDTFSFKGISIGMEATGLKAVNEEHGYWAYDKTTQDYNGYRTTADWMTASMIYLRNDSELTIFGNTVYSMEAGVYQNKIYYMVVSFDDNGSNVVYELANKFGLDTNCIEKSNGEVRGVFKNDKLNVCIAQWEETSYPRKEGGGSLIVCDLKEMDEVEQAMIALSNEREGLTKDSISKDF